jgi:ABC-type Fe3+-hydroxamate transport system substrate-binding protein
MADPSAFRTLCDDLGRSLCLPAFPQRIVSLCPSITETLYALGAGGRVAGRTRFCIHPAGAVSAALRVGGTKDLRYERLARLQPDLIIAEKEENTPEMVARLAESYPVWVFDVLDFASALAMIRRLGELLALESAAEALLARIGLAWEGLPSLAPLRVAYLIWKDPWMAAGRDTYIQSVLHRLGAENVLLTRPERYPAFRLDELAALAPEQIWLSSEPFPFGLREQEMLQDRFPWAEVRLVDGEMFSWYGARMEQAAVYFRSALG